MTCGADQNLMFTMDPSGCLLQGEGDDIQHVCHSKQKLQRDEISKGSAYLLVTTPSVRRGHSVHSKSPQTGTKRNTVFKKRLRGKKQTS